MISTRVTFAAATRNGHERKVARSLQTASVRAGFNGIAATVVVDTDSKGREMVRFPGLVLVELDDEPAALDYVRSFPGVLGWLSGQALPLSPDEVSRMTAVATPAQAAPLQPGELTPGEVVDVTSGPFEGLPLTVTYTDATRVHGLLTVFGRETQVELDASQLARRTG